MAAASRLRSRTPCCIDSLSCLRRPSFFPPAEVRLAALACMRSVSQKPIAQALAFLGQSGKDGKETPQGTDGSLTSFILSGENHKSLNVAWIVRLTRSAAYLFPNAETSLLSFCLHHRHKASFEPLAQRVVFCRQKDLPPRQVFFLSPNMQGQISPPPAFPAPIRRGGYHPPAKAACRLPRSPRPFLILNS